MLKQKASKNSANLRAVYCGVKLHHKELYMLPNFWKLSQGTDFFSFEEISDSIENKLVYVHAHTAAKGRSSETQGDQFIEAEIGDYFYLTHGNRGVYLLGQFTGPAKEKIADTRK